MSLTSRKSSIDTKPRVLQMATLKGLTIINSSKIIMSFDCNNVVVSRRQHDVGLPCHRPIKQNRKAQTTFIFLKLLLAKIVLSELHASNMLWDSCFVNDNML